MGLKLYSVLALKSDFCRLRSILRYLSVVLHAEGALNSRGQVSESSCQESDAEQLLQESRGELLLQLLVRMQGSHIWGRFEVPGGRRAEGM